MFPPLISDPSNLTADPAVTGDPSSTTATPASGSADLSATNAAPVTPEETFNLKLSKRLENEGPKEAHDITTDPIPDACSFTLEKWFHKPHSKKKVVEILSSCERPSNCPSLKVVSINEEVKKTMTRRNHDKDKRMCYLCTAIPKAAQPLSSAWGALLRWEDEIDNSLTTVSLKDFLDNSPIKLKDIITQVELSLKVLGIANVQAIHHACVVPCLGLYLKWCSSPESQPRGGGCGTVNFRMQHSFPMNKSLNVML